MIKKTYLLILVMLFAAPGLFAQAPTVTIGTVEAGPGEILVPVYMENFDNVGVIDLRIDIDTDVLEFLDTANVSALTPNVRAEYDGRAGHEVLKVIWTNVDGVSLDGKWLDLKFEYSGGFETTLKFRDDSQIATDFLAVVEDVVYVDGLVGPDLFIGEVSMATKEADPGEEVHMPVNFFGDGLSAVGGFTLLIEFDPDRLDFGEVVADLAGLEGEEMGAGLVKLNWQSTDAADLSDEKVADIAFTYNGGGPAVLEFRATSRVISPIGATLPVEYKSGVVIAKATDARLIIEDVLKEEQILDPDDLETDPVYAVPVKAEKINEAVASIRMVIAFDGDQIEYADADFMQLNAAGWEVEATANRVDLSWSDTDGGTIEDGELLHLHFAVPGGGAAFSELTFVGGTQVLGMGANILAVGLDHGSLTVTEINLYDVTFNVVDEDGDPITDAVVTLNGVANDAGDYVFEDVMEGTYDYTVEKDGFVTAEGEVVVDDDVTVDVTLMEVTFTVTFVVEDEDGDPIEDAVVTLNGVTNEAGEYVFEDVKAGTYDYSVVKAGYETVEDDVEVEDDTTVTVTLVEVEIPVFTVTFVVEDEDGAAITDAVVTLGDVTNDAGDYVFEDLEAGDYTYTVTADGYHDADGTVEVDDTDVTETVVLSLVTYTVTFDVVDGDGAAITTAVIKLNGDTNAEGDYVFTGLVPGTYDYEVTAAGYFDATGDVEVTDADVDVTVVLAVDDTNIPETGLSVLTLFPNPASSTLNIVSEGSVITEVRAIDMLGQVVYSTSVQDHRHEINVSGYRNGVYFIQVTTAEGIQTHRIQVAR